MSASTAKIINFQSYRQARMAGQVRENQMEFANSAPAFSHQMPGIIWVPYWTPAFAFVPFGSFGG